MMSRRQITSLPGVVVPSLPPSFLSDRPGREARPARIALPFAAIRAAGRRPAATELHPAMIVFFLWVNWIHAIVKMPLNLLKIRNMPLCHDF